jgi:hypothetical protein
MLQGKFTFVDYSVLLQKDGLSVGWLAALNGFSHHIMNQ